MTPALHARLLAALEQETATLLDNINDDNCGSADHRSLVTTLALALIASAMQSHAEPATEKVVHPQCDDGGSWADYRKRTGK